MIHHGYDVTTSKVVAACYTAAIAADLLDAFDLKMHKLTLLPHIHRPTVCLSCLRHTGFLFKFLR